MLASNPQSAIAVWRPQGFGDRRARDIVDPIVEPLWTGPRILAFANGSDVRLIDADGEDIDGFDAISDALAAAAGGATVLIEAYLTAEPIQKPSTIAGRDSVTMPTPAKALSQMIVGSRGDRKDRAQAQLEEAHMRTLEGTVHDVALVAVDLLWLDDESLTDVPLLERKRILESVLAESDLIRVGIHVRPPIDTWLGSWRLFGFRRVAYKAANSRYVPGEKSPEWAIAEIPAR
jgi:hypothetical protein